MAQQLRSQPIRSVWLGFAAALLAAAGASAQHVCAKNQTPSEADARIDALIAQMTISERIAQLGDRAPAIQRLGLPGYNWWNEGLHGLARDGYATVFPQSIGLAATWDAPLLHAIGEAVSTEARQHFARHSGGSPRYAGLTIWSPNVNLFRDPRWGRGQETYGEDPVLTGDLAVQFVRGIQGNDPFYLRADATPKHFAVHSGPETGRDSFNAIVSQHDLNDSYFRAFRQIVTEAHPAAMMCSYNEINGIPSCASGRNLQGTVRDRWGFTGYIVSDCDAVGNINSYHHYAPDAAHGAALALKAGVDLDCGSSYNALNQSYAEGLVSESDINTALHRLLLARLRLGLLDEAACSPFTLPPADRLEDEHYQLALKGAEESAVLLKNDGLLPLSPSRKIAVIGPTADMVSVVEANYHGTARQPVTLLQGLLQAFGNVAYAQGSTLAAGVTVPIPRTALRVDASVQAAGGLHAEYFGRSSFEGVPVATAIVPNIDLDYDRAGPIPSLPPGPFAVRWTGVIRVPPSGETVLRVNADRCWDCKLHDSFRVYLDDKLMLENNGATAEPNRLTIHGNGSVEHALMVELIHAGDDEGIALEWLPPAQALLDEAITAAHTADVIVASVGLSPGLEGEALSIKVDGFAGGDRTALALPQPQAELLRRLQQLGKPIVIALTSGSAIALDQEEQKANAILETWYPGEAGGTALARLLTGAANPSGRLPITFYRSEQDLPPFTDYSMAGRTYRYFDKPVLYPFGYGLSYSSFRYSRATNSVKPFSADSFPMITTNVTNTSSRAGAEVVQLYIQAPPIPGAPRIALQAFQRVELPAGATRSVQFTLTPQQLSAVDTSGKRSVRAGEYHVFVAGQQPNVQSEPSVTIKVKADFTPPSP